MKLRQKPEDFKVEEITDLKISQDKNKFKVYLLEKRSIETFYIIRYISKQNDIPSSEIGIAGLKDKHAFTKQYITIPSKYDIKMKGELNFNLKFVGYSDKEISIGDLTGNKFEIIVRDIKKSDLSGIIQKANDLKKTGAPNYFDSQRFGSVINNQFIAKFLIKKDYENAVKAFLTNTSKSENKEVKEDKRKILENWGKFDKINVKNHDFLEVIDEYNKTKDWLKAYKKIKPNIREIIISAYQSYLWNECIKELLLKNINKNRIYPVPYNIGKLLFYKNANEEELKKLPESFQTISDEIKPKEYEKEIIDKVLLKENVSLKNFDIKNETGSFFKTHERKVVLMPNDFEFSDFETDNLNDKGKNKIFKMKLSFSLPKGSYATIITKRLFNR